PGIIIGTAFLVCSYFLIKKSPGIIEGKSYSFKEKAKATKDAFWGLMAPVIILGGIYSGVFTPTESAGVAAVYGLFVGIFIYKELKFKDLINVLIDSTTSTASIMYIVAFATIFALILTTSQLANNIAENIL